MSAELTVIADNTGFSAYGPNTTVSPWSSRQADAMYKGTYLYALDPGSFRFIFEGTSVAFIGAVPNSSQRPTVTIDDEMVFSTENFDDPTGSTYRQWFQSPTLVDGFHTITVANCTNGTVLDFATVKVGTRSNLTQSTIVVDNENPSILYSGHWSRNTSELTSGSSFRGGYPYGNSTHRSSTPGDTFTFRFTGTSVSVYGLFLWSNTGVLGATYTLDGATIPQIHNITAPYVNREEPNFLYYSMDNLPPGDHTLIGNITVANNHTFVLDYITYDPSFLTTPTSGSINSSTLSSQSSPPGTAQSLLSIAILGGVNGVLALVLLAILGKWLLLRRKKVKQTDDASESHYQPDNGANNQHIQGNEQRHIPQLQPLRSDSQGPQPMKFMRQATDSNIQQPLPDQPPDIYIRPTVTDSEDAAIPPPY